MSTILYNYHLYQSSWSYIPFTLKIIKVTAFIHIEFEPIEFEPIEFVTFTKEFYNNKYIPSKPRTSLPNVDNNMYAYNILKTINAVDLMPKIYPLTKFTRNNKRWAYGK